MSEFGGLWKLEKKKTQHALYNQLGLGSVTLMQLAFLGARDQHFPREKIPLGLQCTKYKTHAPTDPEIKDLGVLGIVRFLRSGGGDSLAAPLLPLGKVRLLADPVHHARQFDGAAVQLLNRVSPLDELGDLVVLLVQVVGQVVVTPWTHTHALLLSLLY